MNHILSRNNAIFLAVVLVVGTISTTMIPTTTFAQSYDDSYTNDYKKHESSVNIQKTKCNNIIINGLDNAAGQGTGGDMMNGMTNDGNDGTWQEDGQWLGKGDEKKKLNNIDKNIINICINQNNENQNNEVLIVAEDGNVHACGDCFIDNLTPEELSILLLIVAPIPINLDQLCEIISVEVAIGNQEILQNLSDNLFMAFMIVGLSTEQFNVVLDCLNEVFDGVIPPPN